MQVLIVFVVAVALDFAYARYTVAAAERERIEAACWSVVVGGMGVLGMLSVVTEPLLAVPWVAGLGVGTALGVKP